MSVTPANGYDALNALPPPRRALVLINPPYQTRDDYPKVIAPLNEGLTRFATGTLTVHAPSADGYGMHGSGMFIINPPWTLQQTLAEIMPYLVKVLGQDSR